MSIVVGPGDMEQIDREWKESDKKYDDTPEEEHKKRRRILESNRKNAIALGSRIKAKWGKTWYSGTIYKIIKNENGKIIGYDVLFDQDGTLGEVKPGDIKKIKNKLNF